jgi:peptidoglycan/LPS O-acetylase OafA/YrhL
VPSSTKRYEALDGLRGLAALSVVLIHVPWPNHLSNLHAAKKVYLLVDLFFVLSGFVLTVVYRDEIGGRDQLRRFLTLRFFRIYPLHVAVLVTLLGIETLKAVAANAGFVVPSTEPFAGPRSLPNFLGHLLLLQGTGAVASSWNGPSWSIGCEAVAYLLFGLATVSGLMKGRIFVPLALILALGCYGLLFGLNGTPGATFDLGLLRCLAAFPLGCAAAIVTQSRPVDSALNATGSHVLSAVTLALIATAAFILCTADGYDELVIIPIFVLLVGFLQCDRGIVAQVLRSRLFAFLGLVSYSLYMINYPIFMMLDSIFKRMFGPGEAGLNPAAGDCLLAVAVLAIVLAARQSFVWIEAPGRKFGRRLAENGVPLKLGDVIRGMVARPAARSRESRRSQAERGRR